MYVCVYFSVICEFGEFNCHSGIPRCVAGYAKCNGYNNCADGSDELNCTSCPSWKFQCDNGHCTYRSWVCDGADDCGDNSDEKNCKFMAKLHLWNDKEMTVNP